MKVGKTLKIIAIFSQHLECLIQIFRVDGFHLENMLFSRKPLMFDLKVNFYIFFVNKQPHEFLTSTHTHTNVHELFRSRNICSGDDVVIKDIACSAIIRTKRKHYVLCVPIDSVLHVDDESMKEASIS
jgi:lantibiotic modifying enzyme